MTDQKLKKLLVLLLLLNIGLAGAFTLFFPLRPHHRSVEKIIQSDKTTAEIQEQPAKPFENQKFSSQTGSLVTSDPRKLSPERGDEILNSATNEDEAFDELRNWARQDPESAVLWGKRQTNSLERDEALTAACFQIVQSDPARAVTLAEDFQLNNDAVLDNLAQQWAAKDLTSAYDWIQTQPAGDQHNALATGMAFIWSQTAPADAAQFVAQQMPPGPAQNEAAMMVLHQWALADSASADAWVQQFPEDPFRNRALNELAGIAEYKQNSAQSKQ